MTEIFVGRLQVLHTHTALSLKMVYNGVFNTVRNMTQINTVPYCLQILNDSDLSILRGLIRNLLSFDVLCADIYHCNCGKM